MGFGAAYDYLIYDLVVDDVPSPDAVVSWLSGPLYELGIQTLGVAKHEFKSPVAGAHAYTITAVLSASHMAVHTAPEHGWVQVAFALCDEIDRREGLGNAIKAFFKPKSVKFTTFRCGIEDAP